MLSQGEVKGFGMQKDSELFLIYVGMLSQLKYLECKRIQCS